MIKNLIIGLSIAFPLFVGAPLVSAATGDDGGSSQPARPKKGDGPVAKPKGPIGGGESRPASRPARPHKGKAGGEGGHKGGAPGGGHKDGGEMMAASLMADGPTHQPKGVHPGTGTGSAHPGTGSAHPGPAPGHNPTGGGIHPGTGAHNPPKKHNPPKPPHNPGGGGPGTGGGGGTPIGPKHKPV